MPTFTARTVRSPGALGRAIRAGRQERGWTQQELAERAVTNRFAVIKLEDGQSTKALTTAFDMLFALDLELVIRPKHSTATAADHPIAAPARDGAAQP